MSPGDVSPRTPERKASASQIFAAFRKLTASQPKSTPQTAALPPALTPLQPTYSAQVRGVLSKRSFSENGSASTVSQEASDDALPATARPVTAVLGGPPELIVYLHRLGKARSLKERADAANKISAILREYRISDPPTIWSVGEHLLHTESEAASQAGYALLEGCARTTALTPSDRLFLFESLSKTEDSRHPELKLRALAAITDDGKNIESIEKQILPYATRALVASFNAANQSRKFKRSNAEESQESCFRLIIDLTKFNARMLHEDDLAALISTIIGICRRTTAFVDIDDSVQLVLTLLTFTQVPAESVDRCLELLADVYGQVAASRNKTWDTLTKIFSSHLRHRVLSFYLETIATGPVKGKKQICRGAFRLIAYLVAQHGQDELPEIPLGLLLSSIENGLKTRDGPLAQDVLQFFKEMLSRSDLRSLLMLEVDLGLFSSSIVTAITTLGLNLFENPANPDIDQSPTAEMSTSSAPDDKGTQIRTESKRTVPRPDAIDIAQATQHAHEIVLTLTTMISQLDVLHKDAVVELLMQLGPGLSNGAAAVLISCYAEDRLLLPFNCASMQASKRLVDGYLHDLDRPSDLRLLTLRVLEDAYNATHPVAEEAASELALLILQSMSDETDVLVLDALANFAAAVMDRAGETLFMTILNVLSATIFRGTQPTASGHHSHGPALTDLPPHSEPSLCRMTVKHVIRSFIANVNKSAFKAEALYAVILKVAAEVNCDIDARICTLKLLFRLRAGSDFALYIQAASESERIAAVLCRTAETADLMQQNEDNKLRESKITSGGGLPGNPKSKPADIRKPVPPLWFYPGPKGLPDEPSAERSIFAYSYAGPMVEAVREDIVTFKLAYWLETIIDLLQQPDTDWEIYSYMIVHLGAQLSNQNLFRGCIPQIKFLRNVLCDQIRASSFHEPPSHTSLKKADVAVCLFHVLTMLVGYHDHFARSEEDDMVRAFTLGIGSWERTSKWCIHALTVSCYELPLSVSKILDSIIQKMSQIITQSHIAIHILEFLVMLARLPELYKNFREDEYKMVFGVSFRYLQSVRDQQSRHQDKDSQTPHISARSSRLQARHSDAFRELHVPLDPEGTHRLRSNTDDLPQYVYALAFHVITFWFMNVKLEDRPMYMPWIRKNLTYHDAEGTEIIEDQGVVTIDMMEKVAYTDRDETVHDPKFAQEVDGEVAQRTWIIGYSLLTIETAGRTGLSQVTRRRPSGTKYSIFKPSLTSPPRHQMPITTGLAADAFYTSSYIGVLPEDIVQEFYSSWNLLDTRSPRPILLPADESVIRAIGTFDRNSTVDGHKVGVIYIAEGQQLEADILANTQGSSDYTDFVSRLGFLTRLQGARFNTQGLDRAEDTDGKYTYCWRDRAIEIVFHITTMMPTNLDYDPQSIKKKSHIGNDFVNIVWNNSGSAFKFDTFPSAFNYVYIVVTPEFTRSFANLREKDQSTNLFYKVQVLSAPGFPEISPAAETKVVSGKALPDFVRLLALNASVFSLVWQNREGGEHFSPWRNRLREIKRLRDKYADKSALAPSKSATGTVRILPPTTLEKTQNEAFASGTLSSPAQNRDQSGAGVGRRKSLANFSGSET